MMTIRRLSIGAGYKYLLKSIAVGDGPEGTDRSDLVRYYAETGTPPGVFLGAGLVGLDNGRGVAVGQSVSAENLQRMLQDCADPITGEVLGRVPSAKAVGGFDLTFSPSKSVSVAWALADKETREVIYRCHQKAIAEVLAYAEREVFHTRSGQQGCVEEDIVGVVAASFTHFDSRDGDPQLHDHVVVLNRAQATSDGVWRTLDSRGLFASTVMLSEMHQGVLSDLLTAELGWDWEAHTRRSSTAPKWEVAGVSKRLMDEFSQRTTAIVDAKDRLIAQFEDDHGRAPDRRRSAQTSPDGDPLHPTREEGSGPRGPDRRVDHSSHALPRRRAHGVGARAGWPRTCPPSRATSSRTRSCSTSPTRPSTS